MSYDYELDENLMALVGEIEMPNEEIIGAGWSVDPPHCTQDQCR